MVQYLALAALGLAGTFLAIGVSIIATIKKPRRLYAYIFFVLSILMTFLFLLGWNAGLLPTSQDDIAKQATQQIDSALPYWIAGIGTLALALMTFYIEIIRPWWNKPKFSVDFDNKKPYCRETTLVQKQVQPPDKHIPAYWLRLKVTNSGSRLARRCIGKLVKVTGASGKKPLDYDPCVLHWVGTSGDEIPLSSIDLNPKDYEYLDILYTRQDIPKKAFICKDLLPRGVYSWFEPGRYSLEITIYGDNIEPETRKYRLTWGATDYKDIKLKLLWAWKGGKMEESTQDRLSTIEHGIKVLIQGQTILNNLGVSVLADNVVLSPALSAQSASSFLFGSIAIAALGISVIALAITAMNVSVWSLILVIPGLAALCYGFIELFRVRKEIQHAGHAVRKAEELLERYKKLSESMDKLERGLVEEFELDEEQNEKTA